MGRTTSILAILVVGCAQSMLAPPDSGAPEGDAGVLPGDDGGQPPLADAGEPGDAGTAPDANVDGGGPAPNACAEVYTNQCDWNEGAVRVRRGADWVTSVTPCAACRHIEQAFYDRAFELGCDCRWPLSECPLNGGSSCIEQQADEASRLLTESQTCDVLMQNARIMSSVLYGGICEVPPPGLD